MQCLGIIISQEIIIQVSIIFRPIGDKFDSGFLIHPVNRSNESSACISSRKIVVHDSICRRCIDQHSHSINRYTGMSSVGRNNPVQFPARYLVYSRAGIYLNNLLLSLHVFTQLFARDIHFIRSNRWIYFASGRSFGCSVGRIHSFVRGHSFVRYNGRHWFGVWSVLVLTKSI